MGAYPPRYWWLKRLSLGMAGLVVLLGLTYAAWNWEASRRLGLALDELAARREVTRAADVNVPDAENAAAYLVRAAEAINPDADCPASTSIPFNGFPPYPPQWFQLADASVAASPKTFELARQARSFDRSVWRAPPNPSGGPSLFAPLAGSPLSKVHHLAVTLGDAALNMHAHGDEVAALETIRDGRRLARAVATFRGLNGALLARNHETIATYRLQIIATDLRIAAEEGAAAGNSEPPAAAATLAKPNPPVRAAPRALVRTLIDELLDERSLDGDVPRALATEQELAVEAGEWAARRTTLLRPMMRLDLARMLEGGRAGFEAAKSPTFPAAQDVLGRAGRLPPPPPAIEYWLGAAPPRGARRKTIDFAHLLSRSDLVVRVDRVLEMDAKVRFERRAAAVSLAAQLYRADHHGEWPPDLAALAPNYLPAVPADPFAPDGGALRYFVARGAFPDGSDRRLVYSVSLNGVDDTPNASALPGNPEFGWRRTRDAYTDLSPWPTTPTTSPVQP